jgi:glycosyltransferase involved in cell wall biosynthesis
MTVGRDVVFTGALSDVRPALVAMDVFVLASVPRSEGAPTAIEEAMMMRLPVVATDVGAVREVVEDGCTGFVVPPLEAPALADAALRILENPEARTLFAARGRERALDRFSAEECARAHLDAYELALRRTGKVATRGEHACRRSLPERSP